jgi:hypothetical protein
MDLIAVLTGAPVRTMERTGLVVPADVLLDLLDALPKLVRVAPSVGLGCMQ